VKLHVLCFEAESCSVVEIAVIFSVIEMSQSGPVLRFVVSRCVVRRSAIRVRTLFQYLNQRVLIPFLCLEFDALPTLKEDSIEIYTSLED
jgi:hypothetical protein